MKILANDGISPSGKEKLEANGYTVITDKVEQGDLINYINENNISALLVRSATTARKDLIDACPNLKFIGRGGVGMDNIDVAYAKEKGLTVKNTPASSSQSVAELAMAHLFSLSRGMYDANRQMPVNGLEKFKDLKKKYGKGIELRGKTIGIIGFGRIGQSLASYALGLGMNVLFHDTFSGKADIVVSINNKDINISLNSSSFEEILSQSDFISLHVPKQDGGKAVIGSDEFSKMKDGVIIINLARGGVIDETALISALDSGKVAAAGLDVFENEPTPNEALLKHPKISLTPHIGAATVEAQDRIGTELADLIMEALPLQHEV